MYWAFISSRSHRRGRGRNCHVRVALLQVHLTRIKNLYFHDVRVTLESLFGSTNQVQYSAYITIGNWWNAVRLGFHQTLITSTISFDWGKKIVLQHPGLFTAGAFTHEVPLHVHARQSRAGACCS